MTERLWVKPKAGLIVRHPATGRPLDPEGEDVTAYRIHFFRQLAAGDVEQIAPPKEE